jgi:geranylgeranyl diphosphate synthase type I
MEKLLLVDKSDQVTGYETKEKCHQRKGLLHRAFSVYLFDNNGRLLIQQRSKFKKLWPLYWANSCCSHPRKDESYEKAGERRLTEELGFSCSLKLVDKFQYQARYKDIGSENELCGILIGKYNNEKIKRNFKEVANWKWVKVEELKKDFRKNPDKYAPWFKIGLKRYLKIKEKESKRRKEFDLFLKDVAEKIDLADRKLLEMDIDNKFRELINYQNSTGGKRLRPALTIISSKIFGGKTKDVLLPAAGLEILHNCTLIIDDIIDHSRLRRNKPTTWTKFGKSIAECVGLGYAASSFASIVYSKEKAARLVKIFSKAMKVIMMNGEIYDILFEQKGRDDEHYITENRYSKVDEEAYYNMAGKKTAELFRACCEVGGVCAEAKEKKIKILKEYGFNLGLAFQIRDDILDIFGEEKKFGKKIGKDIEERKLGNIVILFALQELQKSEKNKILDIFRKKEIKNKDIKEVIKIVKTTDSRRRAEKLANKFLNEVKKRLKFLPQNKWNYFLWLFADFVVQRSK